MNTSKNNENADNGNMSLVQAGTVTIITLNGIRGLSASGAQKQGDTIVKYTT